MALRENDPILERLDYARPAEVYVTTETSEELKNFVSKWVDTAVYNFWLANPNVFICGGLLRAFYAKEKPKDADLYFLNRAAYDSFLAYMQKLGYSPICSTKRATTYKAANEEAVPIQAICFVFGELKTILGEFDFTIVKAGASNELTIMHIDYEEHLEQKQLVYYGSRLPLSSLNRVIKYTRKGYRLKVNQIVALVKDIQDTVDLDDVSSVLYHVESFDPLLLAQVGNTEL